MSEQHFEMVSFETETSTAPSKSGYLQGHSPESNKSGTQKAHRIFYKQVLLPQLDPSVYKQIYDVLNFIRSSEQIHIDVENDREPLDTNIQQYKESAQRLNKVYQKFIWSPRNEIMGAEKTDEVIDVLRVAGFTAIAERLSHLQEITEDEPEDGKPIMMKSLQNFALFMIHERRIPKPMIAVSYGGTLQATWRMPNYGTLVMEFTSFDDVMFTILFSKRAPGIQRHRISGLLPKQRVMHHIAEFVNKLVHDAG